MKQSTKLLYQYGLPAMISFLVLYILGIARFSNLPLKVALSIVYLFTGGYLLSPAMAELVILFLFILTPDRDPARRKSTLTRAGNTKPLQVGVT